MLGEWRCPMCTRTTLYQTESGEPPKDFSAEACGSALCCRLRSLEKTVNELQSRLIEAGVLPDTRP